MEDWQGCLSPLCQTALQKARDSIARRGGHAITVEDFLLALLDEEPAITAFLKGRGVDMDELVRTIQCEQPIVTKVGGEGLLSSQLRQWLATTMELAPATWLEWPQLLRVLTENVECLQAKAYVAVLELVGDWPPAVTAAEPEPALPGAPDSPVVIADTRWLALAENVAITLAADPGALVWLRGPRGSGKTSWLQALVDYLEQGYLCMDLRREDEIPASEAPQIPGNGGPGYSSPPMLLDNLSPAGLLMLLESDLGRAGQWVPGWAGAILLLAPESPADGAAIERLETRLGRRLEIFDMPPSSRCQISAVLIAHQPAMEKRSGIELPDEVIHFAANCCNHQVASPGARIQWLERAAARLNLFARLGTAEALALTGKMETLRRRLLVALARQQPVAELEQQLEELAARRPKAQSVWYERREAGTLRTLQVEDLQQELEHWVAGKGGPVHYVVHCDHSSGESSGAGPGNLHS